MKVLVIGAGYAGLVSGVCFAKGGHTVFIYDKVKERMDSICKGESPFFEEGMQPLLSENVADKRLVASGLEDGFRDSEVILICVGTPPSADGSIDLAQLNALCSELGPLLQHADSRKLFVIRSTVVPGTCAGFAEKLSSLSGKNHPADFGVASNPEFLRQGNAIVDFLHKNPVIIGCDNDDDLVTLIKLYQPFGRPVKTMPLKSAEMAKYLNNCMSATKISFINEAGLLCKELGIDIHEIIDALDLKVGVAGGNLSAGCGFGGGCLEKDARAIMHFAGMRGRRLEVLEKALDANARLPAEIVRILERRLGTLEGRRVGILGLAFKAGTDDLRNSRAVLVIEELRKLGCSVSAFDPKAPGKQLSGVRVFNNPESLIRESEAIVIMTDWSEFSQLNYGDAVVIDAKGSVPKTKRGRNYEGICWP